MTPPTIGSIARTAASSDSLRLFRGDIMMVFREDHFADSAWRDAGKIKEQVQAAIGRGR